MRLKITDTMGITMAVSKRANQPFIQKKEVMKGSVSSPDTKNVYLPPDDTKKKGGHQKWGRGGRYNIYVQVVIVRD